MVRALRMRSNRRNVPGATGKAASALQALKGMLGSPNPSSVPPGPPQAIVGSSQSDAVPDVPMMPPNGATDGLGAGQGGLAIHPSLKAAKLGGYEPRHSSKHR
jgi:hypothetical protein